MDGVATGILDNLAALGDAVRSRLLLVLDRNELTVTELCAVLQLPQSTVSRHLKVLGDGGWVSSRRDGTSRFYTFATPENDSARAGGVSGTNARRVWSLVREQVAATPAAAHDARRLAAVLSRRRTASQEFFATAAGQWDRLRDELFGSTFYLEALLGLLDPAWTVGDLGCGTGVVAAAVAPFVGRVIAVDESNDMLGAARRRLRDVANVEIRRGELESLPIAPAELDVALVVLVLHHLAAPADALASAARALKPGGRLLVVDMLPHDREEYKQHMGHVWLGFPDDQITAWLAQAGLGNIRLRSLPPAPDAKGPALFVATATASEERQ